MTALLRTPAGTLRAPWRIALFVMLAAALVVIATGAGNLIADAAGAGEAMRMLLAWSLSAGALLVAHVIMVAGVERRPLAFVALDREAMRPRALATGTALGALAIGVPSLLLLAVGWLRRVPAADGSWWSEAAVVAVLLLPAALTEELMVRGYLFQVLREGAGAGIALVTTSVVFGLLHLQNDGVTLQSIVLVVLAGVFLGAVLLRLRSLYAVWLAHWAWNLVMAAGLHAAVSGIAFPTPDYRVVDAGPDWATGGRWGPEAGAGAALGMSAALAFLFRRRARREER